MRWRRRSQTLYKRPEDFVFPSERLKGAKPLDLSHGWTRTSLLTWKRSSRPAGRAIRPHGSNPRLQRPDRRREAQGPCVGGPGARRGRVWKGHPSHRVAQNPAAPQRGANSSKSPMVCSYFSSRVKKSELCSRRGPTEGSWKATEQDVATLESNLARISSLRSAGTERRTHCSPGELLPTVIKVQDAR